MCRKLHLCFVSAAWSIGQGSMRRLHCSNYSKIKWTSGSTTNCHSGVTLSASEVQAATSSTIRGIMDTFVNISFQFISLEERRENVLARLHTLLMCGTYLKPPSKSSLKISRTHPSYCTETATLSNDHTSKSGQTGPDPCTVYCSQWNPAKMIQEFPLGIFRSTCLGKF